MKHAIFIAIVALILLACQQNIELRNVVRFGAFIAAVGAPAFIVWYTLIKRKRKVR